MKILISLLILSFITAITCDVYMHNPRGSNNRGCETNNRQTERLFDSQNNAAGGYHCPRSKDRGLQPNIPMYYYEGSSLRIEWTNQHSCGDANSECQIILQYTCDDISPGLRDGYPSNTNVNQGTTEISQATKNDPSFGSHETWEWYHKCTVRKRNRRLFTADEMDDPNGRQTSVRTRQNNNGNRDGFECPEERDYYPYWAPTPWKDIAVLTTNVSRCAWYKKESQNVADRGECSKAGAFSAENNFNECILNGGTWNTTKAWGIDPPACVAAQHSRDNHLGNAAGGKTGEAPSTPHYEWTIPKEGGKKCVLRLRYNITTGDTPWDYDVTKNLLLKNDPVLLKGVAGYVQDVDLELNTNQYGRTFQDRSWVFEIKARPDTVAQSAKIHNINVRGRRGNIVQVYPAVEYDFVPDVSYVAANDYVHFQWTGSDYQNQNNAGQGLAGTDRTNLIQTDTRAKNVPRFLVDNSMFLGADGKPNTDLINKFAMLGQTGCGTTEQINAVANRNTNVLNCGRLNRATTPYFDAGLIQMKASGTFSFICTRNNNFSNRSQKGSMIVRGAQFNASMRMSMSFIAILIATLVLLY